MQRRQFITSGIAATTLGGLSSTSMGESTPSRPYYELLLYEGRIGEPFDRLQHWAEKSLVPSLAKAGVKSLGCFTLALGVETPQLLVVMEHASVDGLQATWRKVGEFPEWRDGLKKVEEGHLPPFDRLEKRLLLATDYSPPLSEAVGKAEKPRFFEFRTYHSPTFRQLLALHQRFSGPEIKIFHRSGIHPIFYADMVFGPKQPCLTYMMPFETLAAREQAWAAFRADPEWVKVRDDSIARAGEIVSHSDRFLYVAAPYSPIL